MSAQAETAGAPAATPGGRTAWARNLAAPVRDYLSTESGGALVLLAAVVAALVWANSPWSSSYESVWTTRLSIRLGDWSIATDLRHWVNQGLMTFFFLVVGLEAKREFDIGALRERKRVALPFVAAIGGMLVPIAIYLAFNAGKSSAHGWGAAMSTDTAFALGVLALIAPSATRLRVRLLTIAVFDDLFALLVIATVYTDHVDTVALVVAIGLFALLAALRFLPFAWRIQVAALIGVGVWVAMFESGVDPVVTGLAVGLVTSAYPPLRSELEQAVDLTRSFREQPTPATVAAAQRGLASTISANERLQYRLHPWVSYVIVPLFALANAGIHIDSGLLGDAITSPITLGIFFGYVVGKPLGYLVSVWLGTRTGLQRALSWPVITGGGVVAGIGFTVSILVATIAFSGQQLEEAKLGVLAAGVAAALSAFGVFRLIRRLPARVRARQLSGTAEELVDLADDVDPERDHIRGSEDAPVTFVEYGDYQCPYCGLAEVIIRELLDSFGDDLRYVWRNLPLNDVHPNAQLAAEAAEAAGPQGKFWEMHDKLITHQDELSPRDLYRYAQELGLDMDRFREDMRRHEFAERIAEDVGTADASGVAGTPTFFINGRRHQGAYDADILSREVRAARARVRAQEKAAAAATV
jgi:Na+/H+ antiporter NhaA